MVIKDRDAKNAIETLQDEFENLEECLKDKDSELLDLQEENDGLKAQVEILMKQIEELEEALAEAYLTSETNNEVSREDAIVSPGCGLNVSDSTGN